MSLLTQTLAVLLAADLISTDDGNATVAQGGNKSHIIHLNEACPALERQTARDRGLSYAAAAAQYPGGYACGCASSHWTTAGWWSREVDGVISRTARLREETATALAAVDVLPHDPNPGRTVFDLATGLRWVATTPYGRSDPQNRRGEAYGRVTALRNLAIDEALATAQQLMETDSYEAELLNQRRLLVRAWQKTSSASGAAMTAMLTEGHFGWSHDALTHHHGWSQGMDVDDPLWFAPRVWVLLSTITPDSLNLWAFIDDLDLAEIRDNNGEVLATIPLLAATGIRSKAIAAPAWGFTGDDLRPALRQAPEGSSVRQRAEFALAIHAARTA